VSPYPIFRILASIQDSIGLAILLTIIELETIMSWLGSECSEEVWTPLLSRLLRVRTKGRLAVIIDEFDSSVQEHLRKEIHLFMRNLYV
jgi:hypothetical protein